MEAEVQDRADRWYRLQIRPSPRPGRPHRRRHPLAGRHRRAAARGRPPPEWARDYAAQHRGGGAGAARRPRRRAPRPLGERGLLRPLPGEARRDRGARLLRARRGGVGRGGAAPGRGRRARRGGPLPGARAGARVPRGRPPRQRRCPAARSLLRPASRWSCSPSRTSPSGGRASATAPSCWRSRRRQRQRAERADARQGPLPGQSVARAPHPAHRDPPPRPGAAEGPPRRGRRRRARRHHRGEHEAPGKAGRGPARRLPHRRRQAQPRPSRRWTGERSYWGSSRG